MRWVLLTRSIFLFFHSFLANAERIALPLTGPGGKIAVFETSKPGNPTFEMSKPGNQTCLNNIYVTSLSIPCLSNIECWSQKHSQNGNIRSINKMSMLQA